MIGQQVRGERSEVRGVVPSIWPSTSNVRPQTSDLRSLTSDLRKEVGAKGFDRTDEAVVACRGCQVASLKTWQLNIC